MVFWLVAGRAGPAAGLTGQFLLLATPLGLLFGRLALPNAAMVACEVAALALLAGRDSTRRAASAAAALVAAILLKPLALPVAAAAWIGLVLRRRFRSAAVLAGCGVVLSAAAWLSIDRVTGGGFSALVALQVERFAADDGFALFRGYEPFAREMRSRGVETAIQWNVSELERSLLPLAPERSANCNGFLVGLAALGALAALVFGPRQNRPLIALALLWLGLPLAFDVLVWEPIWNHYLLQVLPPLAILATLGFTAFDRLPPPGRRVAHAATSVVIVGASMFLAIGVEGRFRFDGNTLRAVGPEGSRWLTFDPTVNVMTGTEAACGVIDPFNVYGESSLAARATDQQARFLVTRENLLACIEADPELRIFVTDWTRWFLDAETLAMLRRDHADRVVFANPRQPVAPASE